MDILGRFPVAEGQVKFLLMAIDYFTKWIKADHFSEDVKIYMEIVDLQRWSPLFQS